MGRPSPAPSVRCLFGGLLVLTSGCAGVPETGLDRPASGAAIEAMNRVWVLNTWDSERWDERYRQAVRAAGQRDGRLRRLRRETIEELSENPPPGGLTSLLGVSPRIRLEVSPTDLTIFREGLDSIHVQLDGTPAPLDRAGQAGTLVGRWENGAVRLEWDFGATGSVLELWELAETRHRLIVTRTVDAGHELPVIFDFRQVYDRSREPRGPGGESPG